MIGWFSRLVMRFRNRHDPAAVMQSRPTPVGGYDAAKAVAGKRQSEQRQARRFRVEAGPRQKKQPADVLPMQPRKRA